MHEHTADIVIIGAGASGLMAAHFCSAGGKQVFLLDHNKEVGKKILISGGGRCNFTNKFSSASSYHSNNPHFCKSALSRFTPDDFIDLLEKHNIEHYEKKDGQLFCKRSAKDITNLLLSQIQKSNVHLQLNQKELQVRRVDHGFQIFNKNTAINCSSLVIATGGLSYPILGASDLGHLIAKQFGHKIIKPMPALVPFKTPSFSGLAGVSLIAEVRCNKHLIQEEVLFTHKGLSGPAILKSSLHWNPRESICINWLPKSNIQELFKGCPGKTSLDKLLKKFLPNNFVNFFLAKIGIDPKLKIAELSKSTTTHLKNELHNMQLIPDKTEGFKKAEVTRGGVDTSKISSKTMESTLCPGLHFTGEVLDVTGQLGGFNFQWAWSSAYAAGSSLA